jgi:pimeloyl-ACP methyl ester carboxylesterase
VTGTAASSGRFYRETRLAESFTPTSYLATPVGHAAFPKEIMAAPRAWLEARYNVTHWTEMPRGGHFAALEQPELLVEDVRTFFRPYR